MTEIPKVKVGIMNESELNFCLHGDYIVNGLTLTGNQSARCMNDNVTWNGNEYEVLLFEPADEAKCHFTLMGVTIGVNFHWERKEDQSFKGALKIIVEDGKLTPINILSVEDYLLSVISSEMSATASKELLKAHAVISRSWLLSQIEKKEKITQAGERYSASEESGDEIVRWWDREDHVNFDVCADDHCQRYQGITRQSTDAVREAIMATWGEVLTYNGELCDARFSKCCGGVYEQFENCWEPKHLDYLVAKRDEKDENDFPDLSDEQNATQWILSKPEAFCNTSDHKVLSQVLNNYDQETQDFYRWTVEYSQDELKNIIQERSETDYGKIKDLQPMSRGTSGRIFRLRIVGEKRTRIIGKELEIRRTLSPSHLYSSAFVVERRDIDSEGYPQKFILRGAGWGHGVGLCQIGAAVMGEKGYDYRQILLHYFINSQITTLYGHE